MRTFPYHYIKRGGEASTSLSPLLERERGIYKPLSTIIKGERLVSNYSISL